MSARPIWGLKGVRSFFIAHHAIAGAVYGPLRPFLSDEKIGGSRTVKRSLICGEKRFSAIFSGSGKAVEIGNVQMKIKGTAAPFLFTISQCFHKFLLRYMVRLFKREVTHRMQGGRDGGGNQVTCFLPINKPLGSNPWPSKKGASPLGSGIHLETEKNTVPQTTKRSWRPKFEAYREGWLCPPVG